MQAVSPKSLPLARAALLLSEMTILCSAHAAFAQTQPPTKATGAPTPQSSAPDIVVTGGRPAVETKIDRKSYSITRDVQASTGSAADVLRNVPSVTVDVDGNPSLRGDANVQILVDGRPSPQFNTGNRGAALEALNADGIDRVEVLTNPPANFKPDGSAGIINIITKRRRGSRTASVQASGGSSGRASFSGSGSLQRGRIGFHATLTVRHDIRTRRFNDDRAVTDPAGSFQSVTHLRGSAGDDRLVKIATLGVDYDFSKADRISAEGTFNARSDTSHFAERNFRLNQNGATVGQSDRARPGHEQEVSSSAMLRFHHDVDTDGNGLTLLAQRSETWERQRFQITDDVTLPFAATSFQDQRIYLDQITREISAEYSTRLPANAKLIAGYNLQRDENLFDNAQTLPVGAGGVALPDVNFTNVFRYGQTIDAFYGSYERPLGNWTLLASFRLEQTGVQTNQITSAQRSEYSYFRAYPNVHLNRKLSEHQTLSLSYGNRVIRPDPEDLNPYTLQQDAFTLRRGNPNLRPQEIQSFEAGWSYDKGAKSRSATLYLRSARNAFTITSTPISPTVVLITEQNLGKNLSGGIEFATSGKLIAKVDYSLSGNVFYNRIDAANLGFAGTRSTVGYEAKGALNWHATGKDTLQFNLAIAGKRLTPQGYRRGYIVTDLGVRHQLRSNIALTATLSDVFASRRDGLVVDTATLHQITTRRQTGRIALLGISWAFLGAKKKAAEKFDYEK